MLEMHKFTFMDRFLNWVHELNKKNDNRIKDLRKKQNEIKYNINSISLSFNFK
jgi:hypothetical protein